MSLTDNIPRQQSGKAISGDLLRQMADRLNRTSRDERTIDLTTEAIGRNPTRVKRFLTKSVSDDHLVCHTWDGTTEGTTDIKVAKPYLLRKKPLHGKTLTIGANVLTFNYTGPTTRTVTKGTSSETQIIVPGYLASGTGYKGHEIYAATGLIDGTGVILNPGTESEERLAWLDLNVDGRYWAKQ